VLVVSLCLLVIFGRHIGEAIATMTSGSYASSRLLGVGAMPFPALPPWAGWDQVFKYREIWALWWPGLLGAAVGAWLLGAGRAVFTGRRTLALALLAFVLLTQLPALSRPLGQMMSSAPLAAALAALAIDLLWARGGRTKGVAYLVSALLFVCGAMQLYAVAVSLIVKLDCPKVSRLYPASMIKRLGSVNIPPQQDRDLANRVKRIQELCPPDKRIYLAALHNLHLSFLSDRANLPPYPYFPEAATRAQRGVVLEALSVKSLPWR